MKNIDTTPTGLKPFLWLWASQSLSAMGTAMTDYALIVWAYEQTGSASSLTLLTLCAYLPTILMRFIAGAAADRWNKKTILLTADLFAASGSLTILALHASGALSMLWLYAINFLLSLMNAFQVPAAYVATSLLVPPEHYARTGGLQTASGAAVSVLSPVLGSLVLGWGGLEAVLAVDLCTFAVAFLTLLALPIPTPAPGAGDRPESFGRSILTGLKFLRARRPLLRMILLIALVNLLAKLGADGQLPAFVLSRTGNDRAALSAVQAAVALGLVAGGSLAALLRPVGREADRILVLCTLIFLTGLLFALSRSVPAWCLFAFLQYLCAALMNVCWGTRMRNAVPIGLQGRVFSARDTLQNATIPLGLYLGGVLTDRVFEPAMADPAGPGGLLAPLLGNEGAGIALLFAAVSALGTAVCALCIGRAAFRDDPRN